MGVSLGHLQNFENAPSLSLVEAEEADAVLDSVVLPFAPYLKVHLKVYLKGPVKVENLHCPGLKVHLKG